MICMWVNVVCGFRNWLQMLRRKTSYRHCRCRRLSGSSRNSGRNIRWALSSISNSFSSGQCSKVLLPPLTLLLFSLNWTVLYAGSHLQNRPLGWMEQVVISVSQCLLVTRDIVLTRFDFATCELLNELFLAVCKIMLNWNRVTLDFCKKVSG